jgi:phosphatidylglycerophosphate synthase
VTRRHAFPEKEERMSPLSPAVDAKASASVLAPAERFCSQHLIRCVPAAVRGYQLTLTSIVWCACAAEACFLAQENRLWLHALSVVIALQYLTDAVDGKVGQVRGDGLVRWGYYMDHLLDYAFLSIILSGYGALLPPQLHAVAGPMVAIGGGFMVSAFLARGATSVLPISFMGIGPVEVRLGLVALNTSVATLGRHSWLRALPLGMGIAVVLLVLLILRTQRQLWRLDRADAVPQPATN